MKNTEKLSGARSFFAESMLKVTQRRFNKLGHVDMDDSLEKLGYNGKQRDGSIVRDIMDIALLCLVIVKYSREQLMMEKFRLHTLSVARQIPSGPEALSAGRLDMRKIEAKNLLKASALPSEDVNCLSL
ncbi:Hypothetical predicted protein [Paramuricea clavata]|uniref:Uncharacterized protein n=1 Tax=Paramuricea clavata TaxID=317549 RepID=A0A7D9EVN2_PARCT|nr:Hypothetical predicted protein [Paramuricea clavata]